MASPPGRPTAEIELGTCSGSIGGEIYKKQTNRGTVMCQNLHSLFSLSERVLFDVLNTQSIMISKKYCSLASLEHHRNDTVKQPESTIYDSMLNSLRYYEIGVET